MLGGLGPPEVVVFAHKANGETCLVMEVPTPGFLSCCKCGGKVSVSGRWVVFLCNSVSFFCPCCVLKNGLIPTNKKEAHLFHSYESDKTYLTPAPMIKSEQLTIRQIQVRFEEGIRKIEENRLGKHEVGCRYLVHLWAMQKSFRRIPSIRDFLANACMGEEIIKFNAKFCYFSKSSTVTMSRNLKATTDDSDLVVDIFLCKNHVLLHFRDKFFARKIKEPSTVRLIKDTVRLNLQIGLYIIRSRVMYQIDRDSLYQAKLVQLRMTDEEAADAQGEIGEMRMKLEFDVLDNTVEVIDRNESKLEDTILLNVSDEMRL